MARAAEVNALVRDLLELVPDVGATIAHRAASNVVRTPTKAAQRLRWLKRDDVAELAPLGVLEVKALELALGRQVRCRECGRELKDAASVKAGIGPDCAAKLAGASA